MIANAIIGAWRDLLFRCQPHLNTRHTPHAGRARVSLVPIRGLEWRRAL